jgi:hypothetical protein
MRRAVIAREIATRVPGTAVRRRLGSQVLALIATERGDELASAHRQGRGARFV